MTREEDRSKAIAALQDGVPFLMITMKDDGALVYADGLKHIEIVGLLTSILDRTRDDGRSHWVYAGGGDPELDGA